MQQFPHVPDRLRNSRVLPTLPNTVPVSREVFEKLHDLEAKAFNLHHDCLHPAFEQYGDIADEANTAVWLFRRLGKQAITDSIALEGAQRSLNDAAEKVHRLLVRYWFMEKLVKEWRGRPPFGKTFKGEAADQKWIHGIVSADVGDTSRVSLIDGTAAFQDIIEGGIRDFLPCTRNSVRFKKSTPNVYRDPSTQSLSALFLSHPPCYIVGWTLSIRTERPGPKTFSVICGGILENDLEINIKAPTFCRADWHCRIYSVDRVDYNFRRLTSK